MRLYAEPDPSFDGDRRGERVSPTSPHHLPLPTDSHRLMLAFRAFIRAVSASRIRKIDPIAKECIALLSNRLANRDPIPNPALASRYMQTSASEDPSLAMLLISKKPLLVSLDADGRGEGAGSMGNGRADAFGFS